MTAVADDYLVRVMLYDVVRALANLLAVRTAIVASLRSQTVARAVRANLFGSFLAHLPLTFLTVSTSLLPNPRARAAQRLFDMRPLLPRAPQLQQLAYRRPKALCILDEARSL